MEYSNNCHMSTPITTSNPLVANPWLSTVRAKHHTSAGVHSNGTTHLPDSSGQYFESGGIVSCLSRTLFITGLEKDQASIIWAHFVCTLSLKPVLNTPEVFVIQSPR